MKLEDQVCSLELAKRLKELGAKQESLYFWSTSNTLLPKERCDFPCYSAFTVAELGESMKAWSNNFPTYYEGKWSKYFKSNEISGKTEADARAKMLIYLIETGLVKPEIHKQREGGMSFIVESSHSVKLFQSKYLPSGTAIFIKDGEVDAFIEWLNAAEKRRTENEALKKKVAELEYSINSCDRIHPYGDARMTPPLTEP